MTMVQSDEQPERQTVKQRIANLDELLQSGMIAESEHKERRKRILDSI